jgi:hypothetical protein
LRSWPAAPQACEGTIVFFRIYDLLVSIDDSMGVADEDLSALLGRAVQALSDTQGNETA